MIWKSDDVCHVPFVYGPSVLVRQCESLKTMLREKIESATGQRIIIHRPQGCPWRTVAELKGVQGPLRSNQSVGGFSVYYLLWAQESVDVHLVVLGVEL